MDQAIYKLIFYGSEFYDYVDFSVYYPLQFSSKANFKTLFKEEEESIPKFFITGFFIKIQF